MKRISSRHNPFFKTLLGLSGDSGARRDAGLVLIEGIHLCDAFLRSGGTPRQVIIGASALDDAEVIDLIDRTEVAEIYALDDPLFSSISQVGPGVAVLMIVEPARPPIPPSITWSAVLLDRLQDPGNVGSILRSTAAAGVSHVFLSTGCAGAWSPKVVRAGMGAHFHLNLFEDCDLHALRGRTALPWIATSPHAARSLYDADLGGDVVWLFGHEGQGLDDRLIDTGSAVRVPQPGDIESLNVAASAAICLFEQVRQRSRSRP
jgi:RNA methyltransferase, TrmH family